MKTQKIKPQYSQEHLLYLRRRKRDHAIVVISRIMLLLLLIGLWELAAQLKRYRYDAGLKGDEAGAVIGKKATTVYKYEAGTLWVSPGDLRALLNEYGVNMVTAFTEIGDPRAGGRKKDESALRWRKMRTYYDMMGPAKQRTLLDVARAMAEDF